MGDLYQLEFLFLSHLSYLFKNLQSTNYAEIGENGVNLSGGQKARVAFARCIYHSSDASAVFLDDPLSSVDIHVASDMFRLGSFCLVLYHAPCEWKNIVKHSILYYIHVFSISLDKY